MEKLKKRGSGKATVAYEHRIDGERCKGCGLCISICPKKVLGLSNTLNDKGYYPAHQAQPEKCVFCAACALMCPDVAIQVKKVNTTM